MSNYADTPMMYFEGVLEQSKLPVEVEAAVPQFVN